MTENNVVGFTDNRIPGNVGRRDSDGHKCVMHDYITNKNDETFKEIRVVIKDNEDSRDHKDEIIEKKLEKFISKWSMGIVILICTSIFMAVSGMAMWQLDKQNSDLAKVSAALEKLTEATTQLTITSTKVVLLQNGVLAELEKLAPEHHELMMHLETFEKDK